MGDKKIHELWKMMPIFNTVYADSIFDDKYVIKGSCFLFSIMLLPITAPLYFIGRIFK